MIKGLKINNCGVFNNFDGEDLGFKEFNLIYGWNYTGKTTLSRIFACFDTKKLPKNYEDVSFKLKTQNGDFDNNRLSELKIKVFNSDYVKDNLSFETQGAKNIIVLAENAKSTLQKIELLTQEANNAKTEITKFQATWTDANSKIERIYTDTAREITNKLSLGRTFNSMQLKNFMGELASHNSESNLIEENILTEEIKTCTTSEEKQAITILEEIPEPNIEIINNTLSKKISIAKVIDRLQNNPDAEEWVREGIILHTDKSTCLYCGGALSQEVINELENHFSETYKNFGLEIEQLKTLCQNFDVTSLPRSIDFYAKFVQDYTELKDNLIKESEKYNIETKKIVDVIDEKLKDRISEFRIDSDYDFNAINEYIKKINEIINQNNEFSKNFLEQTNEMKDKIKKHYVSNMLLDENYKTLISESEKAHRGTETFTKFLKKKMDKIEILNKSISATSEGADKVNNILNTLFLNNTILKLKVEKQGENEVTRLYRGDKIATNLSEGEKTAIAFSHFLASLEDKDNVMQKESLIVFIDDPISSLDSNHIFSVYAYIEKIKEDGYKQLFVSTHNYELYKLFVDYHGKFFPECYYIKKNQGVSKITKIPKKMKKLRTEYNHLFYSLKKFAEEPTFDEIFSIGNALRRFLEIYTASKRPAGEELYKRTQEIARLYEINQILTTAILKIVNTLSHSQIEKYFPDENLLKDAIEQSFEFVKTVDENHFKCLEDKFSEACSSD